MNSKFFKSLALAATMLAASGISAMADDTYNVKMADGTADAEQWTISPNPATAGQTVTLKYNGTKKVKSITAKIIEGNGGGGSTVVEAPEGAIPGLFSVSADKQVYFAKGNLQATTTDLGTNWTWAFAEHQWDCIGSAVANTKINGAGTVSTNGTVDLFGWVGASSNSTGGAMYGIAKTTNDYGSGFSESLKSDWGKVFGDDSPWRTPLDDEWTYLLNTRTTTSGVRYAKACVNGVNGLIIVPDGWSQTTYELKSTNIGEVNYTVNVIALEVWSNLESAGAVFLPAAGQRIGVNVTHVGDYGNYWSSTASNKSSAYYMNFESDLLGTHDPCGRYIAGSVRLVRDAESGSTAGGSTGGGSTGESGDLTGALTLEALTAGTIVVQSPKEGMKYSLNGGAKTAMSGEAITIEVNAGDKVQFCGNGTSITCYQGTSIAGGTAQVKAYGNIMSLVDENGFATATTLSGDNAFYSLFARNATLTDISGLLLPATTLTKSCYAGFFNGCTSLTDASGLLLPATTLTKSCYAGFFNGCSSLTTVPTDLLPATTLTDGCYISLFGGCTSLTTAPALAATTLADNCYQGMFRGCTSLTTAPVLPATTMYNFCYNGMFYGCTSLTATPTLPATTLAEDCYRDMFNSCTGLTSVPANLLPATTLGYSCYLGMFSGCTGLTSVPADLLPATKTAVGCYKSMFNGCTGLTTAPVLPATTLINNCYEEMFKGCSNLSSVTCLATDISTSHCTSDWLDGVAATGTFTTPSETAWEANSASGIPSGWTRVNYQP